MRLDTNSFIFNGYDSLKDFGVAVQEYPHIPFINEDYEEYEIEGKSGTVTINKGTYRNRDITFKLSLVKFDKNTFYQKIDYILSWFRNIKDNRLFYDRSDRCFRVKKVITKDIARQAHYGEGEFEVTFLCEPFLTDDQEGNLVIKGNQELFIDTEIEIPLKIRAYGSGDISIRINENIIQISNIDEYVDIDSTYMQIRDKDGKSKELESIGDFLFFCKGKNNIEISSNVEKVEIKYLNLYL